MLTAFSAVSIGQVSMADSSAQVITYWNIGDQQSYSVLFRTMKVKGEDTLSKETIEYDVDIRVIDSTADGYLVEWFYRNFRNDAPDPVSGKLASLAEDLKVVIETNELGEIKGVKNWEEVSRYMKKSIGQLKASVSPQGGMDALFNQLEAMYTSKHAVESAAIQDAHQFHFFHGGKYVLGQAVETALQVPNIYYPTKPFDAVVTVSLDELNADDNNFVIRSLQEVDSEQLTATTIDYMNSMADKLNGPDIKKEDIGLLSNITAIASRIHGTGWLIYSIQTKTVEGAGMTKIEERIIEIK